MYHSIKHYEVTTSTKIIAQNGKISILERRAAMANDTEENIVKRTCQELGISQAELGRQLDVPASTVGTWASGKIPKMAEVALELMLENKKKDEILQSIKKAQEMIARI
jgi:DNA-binding transcriptional regulator YiaG